MATVQTPHIKLLDEELGFGKTVLMPGDPLREKGFTRMMELALRTAKELESLHDRMPRD